MSDNNQSDRIRQIASWGIIGLIVAVGVSIVLSLYFAPWRPGGFSSHFFFPFHFGWLGTVFLIFIVIFIARWFFGPRRGGREEGYYSFPQQQRPDAASIVKERYAKGEITIEQFDQMMGDLRQHEGARGLRRHNQYCIRLSCTGRYQTYQCTNWIARFK